MQIQSNAAFPEPATNKTNNLLDKIVSESTDFIDFLQAKKSDQVDPNIPSWVDGDYYFDPQNPRKPNMRELMEHLAGKSVEEIYEDPNIDLSVLSKQASDILYGVVGKVKDTRDWGQIMDSNDIVGAALLETALLHEPAIDLETHVETIKKADGTKEEVVINQYPVIRSKSGSVLSSNFSNDEAQMQLELNRFGGENIKFNDDIFTKILIPSFNTSQLDALKKLLS